MKKVILFAALVVLAAACKEKKPAEFTRLGFYTPYQGYLEKLNGKVESVAEKAYWATPESDTYVKGAKITRLEFDSIGYTYDFKAIFDADGDLVSSTTFDENGRVIDVWYLTKVNNLYAKSEYVYDDTVRFRQVITCDEEGNPVLYEGYNMPADTLAQKIEVKGSYLNDTLTAQYYNPKGEAGSKYLFMFNDQGLLTQWEYYRKDGIMWSNQVINYNEKGFESEYTSLDKDKNVSGRTNTTYEYDQMGNWIKSTTRDERGFAVISERIYTYFD